MEKRDEIRMTALDSAISDHRLQMMKAALPYVNVSEQRFFAIYTKAQELMNTVSFYEHSTRDDLSACSLERDTSDPLAMLQDIRAYATGPEAETIDMLINMLGAMDMYRTYQDMMAAQEEQTGDDGEKADPMAMLKAFLPPEQQSMFDTYSAMFNTMG